MALAWQSERSPDLRPKLILHPRWCGVTRSLQEVIVRVKNLIAKILVNFAVQRTRASFRTEVGDTTGEFAPLRTQVAGLNSEFLNRILYGNENRQVDIPDVQWLTVEVLCALIAKRSVDLVVSPTERIHSNRGSGGTALRHNRRSQFDQIENIAPVQRQFIGLALFHNGAHRRRFGVEQRRFALYHYAFKGGTQHHLKIDFERVLNVQNEVSLDDCLEANFFDFNAITTGWQISHVIASCLVRNPLVANARSRVYNDYPGFGNDGAGGVGDAPSQRRIRRLGMKRDCPCETEKRCEAGDSRHEGSPFQPRGSGWSVYTTYALKGSSLMRRAEAEPLHAKSVKD